MERLSISYIDSTNEDVVITYTPSSLVTSYSYVIIKNGVYGEPVVVNSNTPIEFVLEISGTYKIEITNMRRNKVIDVITSGEYKIDKEAPKINIAEKTYEITTKDSFDVMNGITAIDNEDGDLTEKIVTNQASIDFTKEGIKKVQYSVTDNAGNTATEMVYVTVKKNYDDVIKLGQLGVLIAFIVFFAFIYKYINSIRLEKRFSKYTINSTKNKSISLFDNLYNQYVDFINNISKSIGKLNIVQRYAERYNKYNGILYKDDNNINLVSKKIVLGFVYIVFSIIVKLIQAQILKPGEMIIPFVLGFYTLDIILIYQNINYKKKIENDMQQAIIVMNNAFKAGMSITQAVDLVSKELKGPIAREFKKISMEITLGLDIETVFRRFSDRVKLSEAVYLTSSLSVLNKTGGNIIKVFDSIEKTIFNRKKLENEFKALTSSSKLIMYVLMIVPVAFVLFINLINKDYFSVLFNNPIGVMLLIIMLVLYITYIIVVKKVMKVRGIK